MSGLLLDTCAVIWLGQQARISRLAREAILEALEDDAVFVSPFTAWELSLLVARGRLALSTDVRAWFAQFAGQSGLRMADLSTNILIESNRLPGQPPADPADRIIISTARAMNLAVVTRDSRILDYGAAGHVREVAC